MPSVMRQINIISRCENIYRSDVMSAGSGLNPCQHSYVLAICSNPGITQDELAKHIFINKSNVTRHLASLEENGYVRREPNQKDKRSVLVYPTEKMLSVLPQVKQIVSDWNAYITGGIEEDEMKAFRAVLDKLALRASEYMNGREDTTV
jgi:MarR family transcriptional regulator for hemolysin